MRKLLLALLTLVLGVLAVPAAEAGGQSSYVGGCDYAPGHFYVAGVMYTTRDNQNPVTAHVTCTLYRHGVLRHSFDYTAVGLLIGQMDTPVYALDGGTVICTRLDYYYTGDPSDYSCITDTESALADTVFDAGDAIADPVLCPVLGSLAPGVPPFVTVTQQGDVDFAGERRWDCPPYGDPATPDSTSFLGACQFVSGVVVGAVVVYSTDPDENPVTARLTCSIWRDGVLLEYGSATGTGVVPFTGSTSRTGNLTICTDVEFLSTGDPAERTCAPTVNTAVNGAVDTVFDVLFDVTSIPDPIVCPQLASLAPGIPGVVDVTSQGDVAVAGEKQWDCPPYDL